MTITFDVKAEIHIHQHQAPGDQSVMEELKAIKQQGAEILAVLNTPLGELAAKLKQSGDSIENAVKSQS